jgi:pimeloyl-ACP methyl ester carboxylesterase
LYCKAFDRRRKDLLMIVTFLKFLLGLSASLYALLLLLVYCYQDLLVFPGSVIPIQAPAVRGVVEERLALKDGRTFRVAIARPKEPKAVVLWFVGNGEGLARCRYWVDVLAGAERFLTFSPEYPGYEPGTGRAGKATCLEAAELAAARAVAEAKKLGLPLFLGGHSLGTFMASHLAAKGIGERLVLISPPTSICERGEAFFPYIPVRFILRHDLDNLAAAPKIKIPTLILHGTKDTVCPIEDGRRLKKAIRGARLIEIPGENHDPVRLLRAAAKQTREFLRTRP